MVHLFGIIICIFLCLQMRLQLVVQHRHHHPHHDAIRKRVRPNSNNSNNDNHDSGNDRDTAASFDRAEGSTKEYFGDGVPVETDGDEVSTALHGTPSWIREYVLWHRQQRALYPGSELFTHPDAPSLLVRTCFGICGGWNDRVGQIPWDVYIANQTHRVLLWHWHRPAPLESWFQPRILDWRVPTTIPDSPYWFPSSTTGAVVPQAYMLRARQRVPNLFAANTTPDKPEEAFFRRDLDSAIRWARSKTSPKVLRHRLLGHLHEYILEEHLRALGETDMIHTTSTFGRLFHIMFRPSVRLQAIMEHRGIVHHHRRNHHHHHHHHPSEHIDDNNNKQQQQKQNNYVAVHCRVRHPKVGQAGSNAHADKKGLPWFAEDGSDRLQAIDTTNRALQCAKTIFWQQQETSLSKPNISLLADSADLVHYYTHDLKNNDTFHAQQKQSSQLAENTAAALVESIQFVHFDDNHRHNNSTSSSSTTTTEERIPETIHLDLQKGRPVSAYDGTFLDFYALLNAKCIVLGVGNFAWLAAKISQPNMSCVYIHQPEAWGSVQRKLQRVPMCPPPYGVDDKRNTKSVRIDIE